MNGIIGGWVMLVGWIAASGSAADPSVDFPRHFGPFRGAFVLREIGGPLSVRFDAPGCAERLPPCSTFKIFNALAGLDCGVLSDEKTTFKWDGKPKSRKELERDHTLASAIQHSVVWYFQEVARRIGEKRMAEYLVANRYGNADLSGGLTTFWLDSSLAISANEQVAFLERLYTGRLSFNRHAMELVRNLLILERGKDWAFSGKTGTGAVKKGVATLGWFVGHVSHGERQFVFAAHIRGKKGLSGARCREIVFAILKDLELVSTP